VETRLRQRRLLVLGDVLTLALLTVAGFAFHQELEAVGSSRFLATYLPFLAAWLASAGILRALDPQRAIEPRQIWRPCAAALIAAPLGAILRAAWLGTPPVPVFVAVMGLMTLLGLALWRGMYLLLRGSRRQEDAPAK
jgi:hypothetical protein